MLGCWHRTPSRSQYHQYQSCSRESGRVNIEMTFCPKCINVPDIPIGIGYSCQWKAYIETMSQKFSRAATAENHEGRRVMQKQLVLATKQFGSRLTWHAAILSRRYGCQSLCTKCINIPNMDVSFWKTPPHCFSALLLPELCGRRIIMQLRILVRSRFFSLLLFVILWQYLNNYPTPIFF